MEIFGWFGHDHRKVYKNILSYIDPGDHILEIGCLLGKSTYYLANLIENKGATLHCCDLWDSNTASHYEEHCKMFFEKYGEDLYPQFKKNLDSFNFIKAYKMSSEDFFRNEVGDTKFKRIYLDGSHEYSAVRSDIINSIFCIREDGIIAGDDYSNTCDVKLAVDEIFTSSVEFCGPRQWVFDIQKNKDLWKSLLEKYESEQSSKTIVK